MAAKRNAGPWARRTYLTAAVAFAGALGGLGAQMRAGADPAIGAVAAAPATTPPRERIVIIRRIIKTKVITRVVHDRPKQAATPVAAYGSQSVQSVPVRSASVQSAPAQSAPVRSAPVQSAPAPAPVAAPVTRAS